MEKKLNMYEIMILTPEEAEMMFFTEIHKKTPDLQLIEDILDYNSINVNLKDGLGNTLLRWALGDVDKNKENLLEIFLRHPAIDVNLKCHGTTPLMYAMRSGSPKSVKLLLGHPKIDVNFQNKDGRTALIEVITHIKWFKGFEKEIEILLTHPDIDVNLQDEWGWTALIYAAMYRNEKVVELLLNHPGIDVTLKNEHNQTAWEKAKVCIRNGFPKLNPNA